MQKISTNSCIQGNMPIIQNFQQIEKDTREQVMSMTNAMLATIRFDFIYNAHVSTKQKEITAKAVKEYRTKFWAEALKKAKGNKDKAYELYMNLHPI